MAKTAAKKEYKKLIFKRRKESKKVVTDKLQSNLLRANSKNILALLKSMF